MFYSTYYSNKSYLGGSSKSNHTSMILIEDPSQNKAMERNIDKFTDNNELDSELMNFDIETTSWMIVKDLLKLILNIHSTFTLFSLFKNKYYILSLMYNRDFILTNNQSICSAFDWNLFEPWAL